MSTDRIEKRVVLRAPLDRVWRAISDADGVRPLVRRPLRRALHRRQLRHRRPSSPTTVDDVVAKRQEPHAGLKSTWQIVAVEPRRRFAYRWHPFAIDPSRRLRPGADHAGRVHPGRDPRRRAAHHRRIRFRRHPRSSPRRLVRSQLRRLGHPDRSGAQVSDTVSAHTGDRAVDARLFDALGDPNRLRIIVRLCDLGPSSTSQVTDVIPVTRQAASKHLQLLEAAGLVTSARRGRERRLDGADRAVGPGQRLPHPVVAPMGRRGGPVARICGGLSQRL